jgi:predicted metal-dependent RNase
MMNSDGKVEVVNVRARVESVDGFSGHSDRNQLLNYLRRVNPKPRRIVIGHGEKSKCVDLAATVYKQFKLETIAPEIFETIRLI